MENSVKYKPSQMMKSVLTTWNKPDLIHPLTYSDATHRSATFHYLSVMSYYMKIAC